MSGFKALLSGEGWAVAPAWRVLGAALCGMFLLLQFNDTVGNVVYRFDARIVDLWQRLAPPDEPTGEVIVVGIDDAAIRERGRWPWSRLDIARMVEEIAAQNPRSITLDMLLTEPDDFSAANIMRRFRADGPKVLALMEEDPDQALAQAIASAPVALAVGGGSANVISEGGADVLGAGDVGVIGGLDAEASCAVPEIAARGLLEDYHTECLRFPLPVFEQQASALSVAFAEKDLDGILRRARAFVAFPYFDENEALQEAFLPAMPLMAITMCAEYNPACYSFDPNLGFLTDDANAYAGFRMPLHTAVGESPPPTPLTTAFGLWLDFGALRGLMPKPKSLATDAPWPHGVVSASVLFQRDDTFEGDAQELARLTDKHVFVGLTRLGSIDQHATPMAQESGTPGVVIQALAADNLIAGRVLARPGWAGVALQAFCALLAIGALLRFGLTSVSALFGLAFLLVTAPILASWAFFTFGGAVVFGGAPAVAAFLAISPVIYGRIAAIRRDLSAAREMNAREEERMDAARQIQLGSLPFDVDVSELGFEAASLCRPAQEVGGDFFELFQLSDGQLFAAVGDVSGKGLEASLVTALSKSISGAVTDRVDGPLGKAFTEVSREFVRQAPIAWRRDKGGFVTLVAARIDPQTGMAEFACAGCEPPTVVDATGAARPVTLPSVAPLGWIENAQFETATMQLNPGDTIIMFTDGVTEAETLDGALFGQEQAESVVAGLASGGATEVRDGLERAVLAHQNGGAPTDDTTILAVTWRGPVAAKDEAAAETG